MAIEKKESKTIAIRFVRGVTGFDFDGNPATFAAGQEAEVESRFAEDLLRGGNAVLAIPAKAENTAAKHGDKEQRNG